MSQYDMIRLEFRDDALRVSLLKIILALSPS